jgi:hypothetical protein
MSFGFKVGDVMATVIATAILIKDTVETYDGMWGATREYQEFGSAESYGP